MAWGKWPARERSLDEMDGGISRSRLAGASQLSMRTSSAALSLEQFLGKSHKRSGNYRYVSSYCLDALPIRWIRGEVMITSTLRILLLATSVVTAAYIGRGLRKSQIRIADTLYWLFFAAVLVFMGAFPSAVFWLAKTLGIMTPVYFVFLVMIFLLAIRCFLLSLQVSWLEEKLKAFIEETAVREAMKDVKAGAEANAESDMQADAERNIQANVEKNLEADTGQDRKANAEDGITWQGMKADAKDGTTWQGMKADAEAGTTLQGAEADISLESQEAAGVLLHSKAG